MEANFMERNQSGQYFQAKAQKRCNTKAFITKAI